MKRKGESESKENKKQCQELLLYNLPNELILWVLEYCAPREFFLFVFYYYIQEPLMMDEVMCYARNYTLRKTKQPNALRLSNPECRLIHDMILKHYDILNIDDNYKTRCKKCKWDMDCANCGPEESLTIINCKRQCKYNTKSICRVAFNRLLLKTVNNKRQCSDCLNFTTPILMNTEKGSEFKDQEVCYHCKLTYALPKHIKTTYLKENYFTIYRQLFRAQYVDHRLTMFREEKEDYLYKPYPTTKIYNDGDYDCIDRVQVQNTLYPKKHLFIDNTKVK